MKAIERRAEQKAAAESELRARGYELLKREDRFGDTKTGWWCDDVFLGRDPVEAIRVVKGG